MGITRYGWRETVISGLLLGAMAGGFLLLGRQLHPFWGWLALGPAAIFLWVLYFFRNPKRTPPEGEHRIVSPADGVITHIGEVDEPDFIGGRAVRISIFLSVFNVHLNRSPLAGRVAYKQYAKGQFVNAMRDDSGHLNEKNDLGLIAADKRVGKFMIRQIAGLIARRIVCEASHEQELARGEVYGMIKFSSRTELFFPVGSAVTLSAKVGDVVRAGETVLGEVGA